ncbi:hypothetical protein BTVI_72880 [Pitangus sulphuratus]|nr:hypothetical protein BTVI_72880 [Pitangus sulphuratus]
MASCSAAKWNVSINSSNVEGKEMAGGGKNAEWTLGGQGQGQLHADRGFSQTGTKTTEISHPESSGQNMKFFGMIVSFFILFTLTVLRNAVHHSKVSDEEKCTLVNETKWQYYGTPNTYGNLTVTWTPQALAETHVNIEVWGYHETVSKTIFLLCLTGDSYSENWLAEWKYLYTLARAIPNTGKLTFTPVPAEGDYTSAFGDPHFLTFDGLNFTFNGLGEYMLVESDLTSLRVQGRTQQGRLPNGTGAQGTGLSAVAMQENSSDVIEVRYSEDLNLEVLLNQKVLNFSEQTWMDLKGLFLYSTPDQNITVMFSSGSGVEIRGKGGFLSLTVLLPEKFMNHTQGLFGVMNGNTEDEYTFRNKTTLPVHASPQQLFEFGANWAIENGSSLFTYDTEFLLNNFYYGEKHNASFLPVFFPNEDPADPLVGEMVSLCDSDPFCRFDVLTTRSLQVGNSTRLSHQNHRLLVEHLEPGDTTFLKASL